MPSLSVGKIGWGGMAVLMKSKGVQRRKQDIKEDAMVGKRKGLWSLL